jgi:hypothetical protein
MSITSGDFRVYMRRLAGSVWNKQVQAHRLGLSLQEETITEFLLLEMAQELSPLGVYVRMFSKAQEGGRKKSGKVIIEAEGADWEWFVKGLGGCDTIFRVQAKKLYRDRPVKDGHYGGFKPGHKQTDDLIRRAVGANPIYVLFNHPDVSNHSLFGPTRQPDFFGRNCWGCAVTTAQFMKHVGSNSLAAIKPGSVPWHRFFSIGQPCRPANAMKWIAGRSGASPDKQPQGFVRAEGPPEWVSVLTDEQSDLTEYLEEHHLQGVAYFDFSDFRGD